jgi:2-polyprenyl-6-methoxyphenol hydroxylase-like FAD-dependent oxidoreductase
MLSLSKHEGLLLYEVMAAESEITIVGGGIAGLALALHLHERGISCRIYEAAPALKELGVGITVLPHAMRELTALGLGETIEKLGIENTESRFFNRFGQLIYAEKRGRFAGYKVPEIGIHRGRLHMTLYRAVLERLGADAVVTNRQCTGLDQDDDGVTLHFRETSTGAPAPDARARIAVACDGVNSAVRRHFYPDDKVVFSGVNSWRGVTRWKPIFDGRTYLRIGSIRTNKMTLYPIIDNVDGEGRQLINWIAQVPSSAEDRNDWNKPATPEDFVHLFESWVFDWLDVPAMCRAADTILEYPMVDKDPIPRWTFGRVTFAGDAAHPMYPRGSNGSAQALIDVHALADHLTAAREPKDALIAYERERLPATAKIVETNRAEPPDVINIKVEELTGDKPFRNLDDYISQDELRALSGAYQKIAGFSKQDIG